MSKMDWDKARRSESGSKGETAAYVDHTNTPRSEKVCETHDVPRHGVVGKVVDKVKGVRTETTCHQEWQH